MYALHVGPASYKTMEQLMFLDSAAALRCSL